MAKTKIKVTSLSKLLQIGKESEPETVLCEGFFDDQLNYVSDYGPYPSRLFPWEWVYIPEIVARAKQLGVKVPEAPPVDLSKTF